MIAIITEKPAVGKDIARVVGATQRHDGYMSGNGYMVTWAMGHLVALALPDAYGFSRTGASDLPIIPDPFLFTVRQANTPKGSADDKTAVKQLGVIDHVFGQCESIIAATDAGREGELIFRLIYDYLGYTKPFKRLWISSLTDEVILAGLANMKEGSAYDGLYRAADCRAKADWLVGINASRALAISSGMGNNSLGRVQTPTLAMVCGRYRENKDFTPIFYWQLYVTLEKEGGYRKFRYTEDLPGKEEAEKLFERVKTFPATRVTKVERKTAYQPQPLLYDLGSLQKDASVHLDLSPEDTLKLAQSLYEKKLISYPRTGSRHIPEDVFKGIPALLQKIMRMEKFRHVSGLVDVRQPVRRSVNDEKVTDHHALIITGNLPAELPFLELKLYRMIAGRMLEAFGPRCEKESVLMEAEAGGMIFLARSQKILLPRWRGVFNRPEDKEEDEEEKAEGAAGFNEGDMPSISGHSLAQKKTMPKPLFTEATLLTAMETAGKTVPDEAAREAMKELGLGTPATRAGIISTLYKRDYIQRVGKALMPTEKGVAVYNAVKDSRVADAEMTGSWEKMLSGIEKKEVPSDTFMNAIIAYTRQVTGEILSFKFPEPTGVVITCPKCNTGRVTARDKVAKCDNEECGLVVFRKFLNKELTDRHIWQLLSSGETDLIKGLKGKKNKPFDARLVFDKEFNITLSFPEPKRKGRSR